MVNYDKVQPGDTLLLDVQYDNQHLHPGCLDGDEVLVTGKDIDDDEGDWPMIEVRHVVSGENLRLGPGWFRRPH